MNFYPLGFVHLHFRNILMCLKHKCNSHFLSRILEFQCGIQRKQNSFFKTEPVFCNTCFYMIHKDCMGFPGNLSGKESAYKAGDTGSIPGWESSLEERIG